MELSEKLREARLKKGYTQKEVAKKLGLARLRLWGLESGKRGVTARELFELAKFYGKAPEDFFEEEVREEDLLCSFQQYGYPVLSLRTKREPRKLDPTSLVLRVLRQWPDPRYVEGLPVVFFTQSVNYDWLYLQAVRLALQNRLAFAVDLTLKAFRVAGVMKDREVLEDLLTKLEKVKLEREETLRGEAPEGSGLSLLREMADPLATKWKLLANFPLESVTRWVLRAKKTQASSRT